YPWRFLPNLPVPLHILIGRNNPVDTLGDPGSFFIHNVSKQCWKKSFSTWVKQGTLPCDNLTDSTVFTFRGTPTNSHVFPLYSIFISESNGDIFQDNCGCML